MLTPDQFLGFLLAAVLITASPGPDNLMVLGIGMSKGRASGIAFGLGCALGCLSHTALAVIGVGALIAASPPAFTALKIGGGLYLLWLSYGALRSGGGARVDTTVQLERTWRALFMKGVIANAINPKVALFFLSFLPQFVDAKAGALAWQMALLGLVFMAQTVVIFGAVALFSGWIGERLRAHPAAGERLNVFAGLTFIALGIRVAMPDLGAARP